MPRSVPLSVRISDTDAAFLARYKAEGATTPSEKLRALLAEARQQDEAQMDLDGRIEQLSRQIKPALTRLRTSQREARMRSDLLVRLYDRLPELVALLMTGPGYGTSPANDLREFEEDVAQQTFALIEDVLDLGLTQNDRTYAPEQIRKRLAPIVEITGLMRQQEAKEGKTS